MLSLKDKTNEDKNKYIDAIFTLIKAMENEYIKVFVPLNKNKSIDQEYKDELKRYIGVLHYLHDKRSYIPKELFIKILEDIISKKIFSHIDKKENL